MLQQNKAAAAAASAAVEAEIEKAKGERGDNPSEAGAVFEW